MTEPDQAAPVDLDAAPTVRQHIGATFRRYRLAVDATADEVAAAARAMGLRWDGHLIGQLECGHKAISVETLMALPELLHACGLKGISPMDFLPSGLPERPPVHDRVTETERKAARAVGIEPAMMRAIALDLWGRSLVEERDRRTGHDVSGRSRQAVRGHVTRALLAELRAAT